MFAFPCLGCRTMLAVEATGIGGQVQCTGCGFVQIVPAGFSVATPIQAPPPASLSANIDMRLPDRRRYSPFRWGLGVGCGTIAAVALTIGGCLFVVLRRPVAQLIDAVSRSRGVHTWHDGTENPSLGPISVGVTEVWVEDFGREGNVPRRYLMVRLAIKNSDPARKITYHGWQGGDFEVVGSMAATIEDGHGNFYRCTEFRLGSPPLNHESIYPGKQGSDLLIFDAPPDAGKELRLTLPGSAVGQEGEIRLVIPSASIRFDN